MCGDVLSDYRDLFEEESLTECSYAAKGRTITSIFQMMLSSVLRKLKLQITVDESYHCR